jgi:N6-adenosine-specific RNA methylase IME4
MNRKETNPGEDLWQMMMEDCEKQKAGLKRTEQLYHRGDKAVNLCQNSDKGYINDDFDLNVNETLYQRADKAFKNDLNKDFDLNVNETLYPSGKSVQNNIIIKFKEVIPPLTKEEYSGLEESILKEGCRDELVVWGDILIDGHNRYEICQKHNIKIKTKEINFNNEDEARLWIIKNQFNRRNIPISVRAELALEYESIFRKKGKENMGFRTDLCHRGDKGSNPSEDLFDTIDCVDTKKELAKMAGVSHDTISRVKKIKEINPEVLKKINSGELTINTAYINIMKEEKHNNQLNSLKEKEIIPITSKYDVIVIDPPWQMEKIEREVAPNQIGFDYPTMTLDEIKYFKLPSDDNCHVFLWTTQKWLPYSFEVFNTWGVKYVLTMVWHKNGGFQPFNLPQYNCEFILYGRIGAPIFTDLKDFMTCFNGVRKGHSVKPSEFYDVIRRVTAGKRIDIFNRRKIEGFDTWGDEKK